jgi:hypothetical protein
VCAPACLRQASSDGYAKGGWIRWLEKWAMIDGLQLCLHPLPPWFHGDAPSRCLLCVWLRCAALPVTAARARQPATPCDAALCSPGQSQRGRADSSGLLALSSSLPIIWQMSQRQGLHARRHDRAANNNITAPARRG